jgi:hypothetical protein
MDADGKDNSQPPPRHQERQEEFNRIHLGALGVLAVKILSSRISSVSI